MLNINEKTIVYIYTPARSVSGGPEALHQLAYYMAIAGANVRTIYYGMGEDKENLTPPRYAKYHPNIVEESSVIDDPNNVVIAPESATILLNKFVRVQRCVWWLGVVCYDGKYAGRFRKLVMAILSSIKHFTLNPIRVFNEKVRCARACPNMLDCSISHFCGSQFAFDYLTNAGCENVKLLVEPISKEFLDIGMATDLSSSTRSNEIAYNPSKPSKIMTKLLNDGAYKFVPIKGMTPVQIAELFSRTKLYIDFGEFGGPERLPKEATYNGCTILVAKHNASVNNFDIAIPESYKIEDYNDIQLVKEKIDNMLDNYDNIIEDFASFRKKIDELEKNFVAQISDNFLPKQLDRKERKI